MEPEKIQRIDAEDDPNRCQAVTPRGQCINKAVEGGKNCLVHGGNKQLQSQRTKSLNNYRLDRWKARIQRFSGSSHIKNLHDEIGILRMLLEERLLQCHSPNDLTIHSQQIMNMVMTVERVVNSCHKLELSMGQLLDRNALDEFAANVISTISEHVTDPDLLDTLAQAILGNLESNDTPK